MTGWAAGVRLDSWLPRRERWLAASLATTLRLRATIVGDRFVVSALVVLAAAIRLSGIEARGRFDADEAVDMLVLGRLVSEGSLPLLGPTASVGEIHHGALYYLLLAPVALLSNAQPLAITATMAAYGVGAVALTWLLARSIAGPLAGLLAGLALAVSPAAIESSTFIWIVNPIPFFAALSLAAAWRARSTGRARWWVVALGAAGAVWQLHLVGVVFLVPIAGLLAADAWRARRQGAPGATRRIGWAVLGGMGAIGMLFLPFAIHEALTGLSESQRILAYLSTSGEPGRLDALARLLVVVFRAVSGPISGVVTDAPLAALVAFLGISSICGWTLLAERGERRLAVAWLVMTVGWAAIALTFAAPSLDSVVRFLPNDHYHSFLLPAIAALLGVGLSAMWRRLPLLALVLALTLGGIAVARWPQVDPNGGWPAARASGERAARIVGSAPVAVIGLPSFKSVAGTAYPLAVAGAHLADQREARFLVVPCDRPFELVIGSSCGGPAEDQLVRRLWAGAEPKLAGRFDASPRIAISVYALDPNRN